MIRRVAVFGLDLVKMDIRQESTKHSEAMGALTSYLGYGDYSQWTEGEKLEFLERELESKRPLFPQELSSVLPEDAKEVIDTFMTIVQLGANHLGAYVISMTHAPSDILLVELLQREALLHGPAPPVKGPPTLRVVPLFETLEDLQNAPSILERLFSIPWYKKHLEKHNNRQEVRFLSARM